TSAISNRVSSSSSSSSSSSFLPRNRLARPSVMSARVRLSPSRSRASQLLRRLGSAEASAAAAAGAAAGSACCSPAGRSTGWSCCSGCVCFALSFLRKPHMGRYCPSLGPWRPAVGDCIRELPVSYHRSLDLPPFRRRERLCMHRLLFIVLVLLALPLTAASAAERPQIQEFMLKNGMKVVVRPDHRAPVVVSMVWYRIGSSYEEPGLTGISHVLEHMMFKGTTRYPGGEFSRIIAEQGGRENAFTGRDFTAYFQQLAADRLPIALELEADRMRNLRLREEDLRSEVQVVMEERRLRA